MFSASAEFYDLIYGPIKDYAAEVRRLSQLIGERAPRSRSILDVACGTGEHARHLTEAGFTVDGVDFDSAFVELARRKNPNSRFVCQDMTQLSIGQTYDAVICLFSSIGYVKTEAMLRETIKRFSEHVRDGGVIIVEPWFEPQAMQDGYIAMQVAQDSDTKICRMSVTRLIDGISQLEFEYLIGRRGALERRSETHQLGLFTSSQIHNAFANAGLSADYDAEGLSGRGLYVARKGRETA